MEPTRKNFFEETMPKLKEQFAGQGALSSGGFNRAVADAAADMNTQLGAQLAKAVQQGEQQNLQERQLGLSTLDQALKEMNALMQAGRQQRGIEQFSLDAELQKWQMGQPYNNPWLQQAPTALGVSPYQIDTYTKGGGSGLLGGMASGFGQGLGSQMVGGSSAPDYGTSPGTASYHPPAMG